MSSIDRLVTFAVAAFAFCALCGAAAAGPTLAPPFDASYTLQDLGPVEGVPTPYGGLFILPGRPNTLYLGGTANRPDGALYAVPITRDEGGHIIAIAGPGVRVADAPYNDGGIVRDAGGLISYARWPVNIYSQVDLATGAVVNNVALNSLGIATSAAAVAFIPGGYPGAGGMRIASYGGGQFYEVDYSVGEQGLIRIHSATIVGDSQLSGGPEGWTYVPLGSPQFTAPSMIVSEYSAGLVAVYEMDSRGNPLTGSRRLFIDGLTGAEGAAIDPVSGEFMFSTFGYVNHVVVVRGFATPPSLSLTPAALTFAAASLGVTSAPQHITLANNGPGALHISSMTASGDFAFTSDCPESMPAESSCDIQVAFTAHAAGGRSGTLSILTNASGSPYTVALSGTGLASAAVPSPRLAPGTMEFAPQEVGSESALQFATLFNEGTGTLRLDAVTVQGEFAATQSFASSRGPCSTELAAGASCDIGLAFRPAAQGVREGSLRIETNAPDPVSLLRLIGTGVVTPPPRNLSVVDNMTFATQRLGTRSEGVPLKIRNNSTAVASITGLDASGDFQVSDTCATIAAGGSCSPLVYFQPSAIGARAGALTVRALSEADPYIVTLSGLGESNPLPALAISVTRMGFGNGIVGSMASNGVVLTNVGDAPVVIQSIAATGDFIAMHQCATLAPQTTCPVQVLFQPQDAGRRIGALEIRSNAEGSPHHVELSGVGCSMPNTSQLRLGRELCGR
jgi:hypothetical protein